jgi:hypothetical protein
MTRPAAPRGGFGVPPLSIRILQANAAIVMGNHTVTVQVAITRMNANVTLSGEVLKESDGSHLADLTFGAPPPTNLIVNSAQANLGANLPPYVVYATVQDTTVGSAANASDCQQT